MLAAVTLGLAGCFSPSIEGGLKLSDAAVAPPSIAQEGVLRVGVDSSGVPFAGPSEGRIIGIDVDTAAALAEQMGLRLEVVDVKGQDANAVLGAGTVDVVMGIQGEAAGAFTGSQVGPYVVDGPAAFTVGLSGEAPAFDPAVLGGVPIAAQEGSLSAWQVDRDYGSGNLRAYPTLNAVFDELSSGSVSYAAADAVVGSFLALQQYEGIRCVGLLSEPQGVYMGVATEKQELLSRLTDALRSLRDEGNLQTIIAKWLGPQSAVTVLGSQAIVTLPSGGEAQTGTGQGALGTTDASVVPTDGGAAMPADGGTEGADGQPSDGSAESLAQE
jgi:polar amino acid transport system substrate-binding protein